MDDDVPESVKRERLERLKELQRQITAERYERFVGRTARAMIDRVVDGEAQARTVWQADDIDGVTFLDGAELARARHDRRRRDRRRRGRRRLPRVAAARGGSRRLRAARRRAARAARDEHVDRELRAVTTPGQCARRHARTS